VSGSRSPQHRVLPDVPGGPAEVVIDRPPGSAAGLIFLGHGAGGGVESPDLLAARAAAVELGWVVARVVQPYRVAGRRAPAPAEKLDAAWLAVVAEVRRQRALAAVPMVFGGRSSGARVACRTALTGTAAGVLALAFPLHPPGRPEKDRGDELRATGVPVVVVQGTRDSFGGPDDVRRAAQTAAVVVHEVEAADHSLRTAAATATIRAATGELLASVSAR
jgi:predicted alpha/beta-hydrolase family hydrolase